VVAGLDARSRRSPSGSTARARTRKGLQAPNRAHDLRTYFEKSGIRVHDRTAGGSPELLRVSLARAGREGALAAVAPGDAVVSQENRVEIRRPGLVEWYVNSKAGLEQGFTVEARPGGAGPLVLELAVAGARAARAGDAIVFATGAQRKLRYGELAATAVDGDSLAAHFDLPRPDRLRIVVDDAGASYPIAIDPLLTETADTQLESDQTDARLGISVAGAGDVNGDGYDDVIVGAVDYDAGQTDEGAAFVFHGSATGVADGNPSTAAAQLESDQAGAHFGRSVASAGDVNGDGYADVIVGALYYDAGQMDEGAAFVFHGSATGVADGNPSTAATQLESDQVSGLLGRGVDSAGDVNGDGYGDVIVGANTYNAGQTWEGAAFVFHGSATGVADGNPSTAATQLESDQVSGLLGRGVDSAGDVNGDGYGDVIVGANTYNAGQTWEGAAFVFHSSATGVADGNPSTAATQLESDQAGALLGRSVASAGDVNGDGYGDVIVGVNSYDAGQTDEGAAFVFYGSATGVADGSTATSNAQLEGDQESASLGISVASAGDVDGDGYGDMIVGAHGYGSGETGEGIARVFPEPAGWLPFAGGAALLALLSVQRRRVGLLAVSGAARAPRRCVATSRRDPHRVGAARPAGR
jgi:FG-GAP repeat protein